MHKKKAIMSKFVNFIIFSLPTSLSFNNLAILFTFEFKSLLNLKEISSSIKYSSITIFFNNTNDKSFKIIF